VSYDFYQDPDTGRYSTRKCRTDFLQKLYPETQREATGGPGGGTRSQPKYDGVFYIAARFSAESASSGSGVPFYLQETIGGSDIDGIPTLRASRITAFAGWTSS
jgi:hypothetical protein